MFGSLSLYGQTFMYSYTDPCTHELKFITYDYSAPVIISYYGQTRAFTYTEINSGAFESWLNQVYTNHQASPCDEVLTSVTTTSTTNLTTNVINTVLNLSTITSLSSVSVNVGGTVNTGNQSNGGNNEEGDENNQSGGSSSQSSSNTTNNSGGNSNNSGSAGSTNGGSGTSVGSNGSGNSSSSGSNTGGSSGSSGSNQGGSNSSGSNSSGSNSGGSGTGGSGNGSGSSGSNSGGNGGGSGGGTDKGSTSGGTGSGSNQGGVQEGSQEGATSQEEIQDIKDDQANVSSQQSTKTTSKAKTEVQKPAILVTGDIVGLQKTEDGSQDARGTVSFTRVKGDGTSSLGLSADYMVNARIANITAMKSWIGTNEKGNKHINLVSTGFSFQPSAWSNTSMFIRINSLKRTTWIFGAAGSAGVLYEEPIFSTLGIVGYMYKGKLFRNVDATLIAAGVYSPYTKYYTEEWFTNRPIIIPFFNLNYKVTKTFGFGLTGGGTYMAGQNVLNYQVLLGAKLIL